MQNPNSTSLNDDVIREILLRLPAKSICRFRRVSKRWRSLTSDPQFVAAHAATAPSPATDQGFFVYDIRGEQSEYFPLHDSCRPSNPTLSFLDFKGVPPRLAESRSGLVLCRLPGKFILHNKPYRISVCNPTTQEHAVVPVPEEKMYDDLIGAALCLAFDPSKSPHFRIVAAGAEYRPETRNVYKFSSETWSWKVLDVRVGIYPSHTKAVYWNGSIYWWNKYRGGELLALDVEGEFLWKPLLPDPGTRMKYMYFGESGGYLHFIRGNAGEFNTQFDVLEMGLESTGWRVLYSVDLFSIKDVHPEAIFGPKLAVQAISPVAFFRGGDGVGDMMLLDIPGKIVSYHVQEMIFRLICDNQPINNDFVIYPLVHTLFSLSRNAAPLHQDWLCWKSEHDNLLINLMVENSLKKNSRLGFKMTAWHDIVERFNRATQLNYDVRHLKNRLISYKREYQTVKKITMNDGFCWLSSKQILSGGDDHWKQYLERNFRAVVYKRKQVRYTDLRIICAQSISSNQETSFTKTEGDDKFERNDVCEGISNGMEIIGAPSISSSQETSLSRTEGADTFERNDVCEGISNEMVVSPGVHAFGFFLYVPYKNWLAEFIYLDSDWHLSDPTLSFLDFKGFPPELADSCNGLILCRLPCKFIRENKPFPLSICNPTTQEHEVISVPDEIYTDILDASLGLAFDPLVSPHFRIFAVAHSYEEGKQHIYKYSSETRAWKVIDARMNIEPPHRSVLWNGSLIWWDHCNAENLLALDVEEEYLWMPLLAQPKTGMKYLYFGESRGCLYFIRGNAEEFNTQFDILEMASETSGWCVLYSVDLCSIKDVYPEAIASPKMSTLATSIVGFIRGGDKVGDRMLLRIPIKIISYHLQEKTFTTICDNLSTNYFYEIYPLAQSLFSLNAARPHQDWLCWKNEHDKILIKLMVDQSLNGNRKLLGFSNMIAWHEMVESFNKTTQLKYNFRHLKNRLKTYNRECQTVKKLVMDNGFNWDPSKQMLNASDAHWTRYLKRNPKAAVYKRKHVSFRELKIICLSSSTGCEEISFSETEDAEMKGTDDTSKASGNDTVEIQGVHSDNRSASADLCAAFSQDAQQARPLKRKR